MRATIFLIAILLSSIFSFGQDWLSKIDPSVWQAATDGKEVDFLVILTEQADVSEAVYFPKKEDKGTYVYQQLSSTAERTQTNVVQILADFSAPHRTYWIINAVWGKGGKSLLENIALLPEVAEIHANSPIQIEEPRRVEESGDRAVEWGISNIHADDVWALGYTGKNVVVGGQDTGYDWDVAALKLKYRGWDDVAGTADHNYNWHDAIHAPPLPDPCPNIDCGCDTVEPCDDHDHGTHTMGTMVGSEGANEIGVAPDAKWIGCRNMDEGVGTPTTYIECFQWFLAPTDLNDQNPDPAKAPHVINNSWSCPTSEGCNSGNWSDMETAINNLLSAGVFIVASAGNSGSGCSTVNAPPAMFAGSFSVGASNSSNTIAGFSSRGPVTVDGSNRMKPDVSAPGVSVRSCVRNGGYATWNGTSMAGPHVAGAVALLIEADPSLAGQIGQIATFLENNAGGQTTTQGCGGDNPTDSPNNTYGHGIINVLDAVNDALGLLPIELIDFTAILSSNGVQLNWEAALPGTLNHFEIEHTSHSLKWETIGKTPFHPNAGRYAFLDENPEPGMNYYRLKMIDMDGSYVFSKVVSVQIDEATGLSISPNPARNELTLFADWETGQSAIFIFDANGRMIKKIEEITLEKGKIISVDLEDLPSGIYFLKIMGNNAQQLLFQNRFVKI